MRLSGGRNRTTLRQAQRRPQIMCTISSGLEEAAATLFDGVKARFYADHPPAIRMVPELYKAS